MPENHRYEYGDDLADIGAQQVADYFFDIGINSPSFAHGIDDSGKIVIGQRHVRSTFCHIRAGDSHCTADISCFQSRCIVHAVPGHGDNLTFALPCFDDADFIFRRDTRVDGNVFHFIVQFGIGHGVQLGACDGLVAFGQDTKLSGDGRGGGNVVSGNHDRTDARFFADCHSSFCLRARRVDHTHKTHKGQPVFKFFRGENFRHSRKFFVTDCQHTQSSVAHFFVDLACGLDISGNAAGSHNIEGTFYDYEDFAVDFIDGGHQFTV